MTNRIDRISALGLVQRIPDPNDRRGVLVELTPKGLELVDRAIGVRFNEAQELVDLLKPKERESLESSLRSLLLALQEKKPK